MSVLRVVYDLKSAPVTFDFMGFLAYSECMRQLTKDASIHVTILADGFRTQTQRDVDTPDSEKLARIHGILLQLIPLVPTISGYAVEHLGPYDYQVTQPYSSPYTPAKVKEFFDKGADPRFVKAPEFAVSKVPECDFTLTLRNSSHFKGRNVDLKDWYSFYEKLNKVGYRVAVIPDQEDLLSAAECRTFDWWLYEPAAWNMSLRMALYERANVNICSANGPASAMYYSHCKFLLFDILRGGVFNAESWCDLHGVEVGESPAWLGEGQRVTWTNSTYDNLVAEFEGLDDI